MLTLATCDHFAQYVFVCYKPERHDQGQNPPKRQRGVPLTIIRFRHSSTMWKMWLTKAFSSTHLFSQCHLLQTNSARVDSRKHHSGSKKEKAKKEPAEKEPAKKETAKKEMATNGAKKKGKMRDLKAKKNQA